MSDILKDRFKESIGSEVEIFLENGFRYKGKITNCDDHYIEILDYKSNSYIVLELKDIENAKVSIGNGGVEND